MKSKATYIPHIRLLDVDDLAWRVDWLGHFAFPDTQRRWTSPSICVVLSSVTAPGDVGGQRSRQKEIWLPLGFLPLMRVGEVWHRGRSVGELEGIQETFERVRIDEATVSHVKAGSQSEKKYFFLPLDEHGGHLRHTKSWCVAVMLSDGKQLLVPAWELIRFYFGSSSALVTRLFKPDLRKSMLFKDDWRYHGGSGRLYIELAEGLGRASAADIGRIALSNVAWDAVSRIGLSCLQAAAQRDRIYPKMQFPFLGDTDLVARGQWLSHGPSAKTTFVVHELLSCSHRLPYGGIGYRDDRPFQVPSAEGGNSGAGGQSFAKRSSGDYSLRDEDPGKASSPQRRAFGGHERFPDLVSKPIWRSREIQPSSNQSATRATQSATADESTGQAYGTRPIRQIDLELNVLGAEEESARALPEFARTGIQMVLAQKDFDVVELVLLNGTDDPIYSIPLVRLEQGADVAGCEVPRATSPRLWRCLVLSLSSDERSRRYQLIGEQENSKAPWCVPLPKVSLEPALELVLVEMMAMRTAAHGAIPTSPRIQ